MYATGFLNMYHTLLQILWTYKKFWEGARGSVVGWGTMLQTGISRLRFLIKSFDFSIDLVLPAAL
jgi:hypothetical protein